MADREPSALTQWRVRSHGVTRFPTLKLFKNGELWEIYKGPRDAPMLEHYLVGHLELGAAWPCARAPVLLSAQRDASIARAIRFGA